MCHKNISAEAMVSPLACCAWGQLLHLHGPLSRNQFQGLFTGNTRDCRQIRRPPLLVSEVLCQAEYWMLNCLCVCVLSVDRRLKSSLFCDDEMTMMTMMTMRMTSPPSIVSISISRRRHGTLVTSLVWLAVMTSSIKIGGK